jgi:hypothetical protein
MLSPYLDELAKSSMEQRWAVPRGLVGRSPSPVSPREPTRAKQDVAWVDGRWGQICVNLSLHYRPSKPGFSITKPTSFVHRAPDPIQLEISPASTGRVCLPTMPHQVVVHSVQFLHSLGNPSPYSFIPAVHLPYRAHLHGGKELTVRGRAAQEITQTSAPDPRGTKPQFLRYALLLFPLAGLRP